jgi:predicted acyl esterase
LRARVFEIDEVGGSILLAADTLRARYRTDSRRAQLVSTQEPLRYEFDQFTFISRLIRTGRRLRLVVGPIDSICEERNFNSGGVVAEESAADARTVTVRLYHDTSYASVLHVPIGQAEA